MKRTIVLVLTLCAVLFPLLQPALAQEEKENDAKSLFINLTSDQVNRARMAITLAHRVLVEKKIPVTIWLNVEGVRLLDGRLLQPRYGDGKSNLEVLEAFMRDGGTVMVCPMCMKNVGGLEVKDLPKGVILSEMEVFWEKAFAEDVTVLSY
jgi:sulfur relay (sulfurtransferase) complex TusBCD TusD component (DsrE family)